MREKDLKHILQQPFKFETWKELLPLFLKKVSYFNRPETRWIWKPVNSSRVKPNLSGSPIYQE